MADDFDKLEAFKQWMQSEFTQQCKKKYGTDVFNRYINAHLEDFLVSIEGHMEHLAEVSCSEDTFGTSDFDEE